MEIDGEDSLDQEFIDKYIREESKDSDAETNSFKERFKPKDSGAMEVFGSIGEGESYPEHNNFNRRHWDSNRDDELPDERTKSTPGPMTEVKKEILKYLEKDSLTLDTCERINKDWKK